MRSLFTGSLMAANRRQILLLLYLVTTAGRTQVVNDGATNTLNNVTNTVAGAVTIGTNGDFTLLIITNNALLTNSGNGVIGLNAGADTNAVRVDGTNSRWLMSGDLYVGSNGSGNSLLITNGGRVANNFGWVGYTAASSNNTVTVSGTSSLWTNAGDLTIGYSGSFNTLLITNGGTARAALAGWVGFQAGANSNRVIVGGSNSLWQNALDTTIGHQGAGNSMLISGGGQVANGKGWIGRAATASNNSVTVTGANSLWTNAGLLRVGADGSGNSLLIANGATVANTAGYVGSNAVAQNNQVTVTGTNSLWTNSSDLYVGNSGSFNSLLISNGGTVVNNFGEIGFNSGASNNQVTVTGAGSRWANNAAVGVGSIGAFNTLLISNGGTVAGTSASIGVNSGANNNQVIVTGANSLWTNSSELEVGGFGLFNTLLIASGGTVADTDAFLGRFAGVNSNQVTVTGTNSRWNNSGNLFVGNSGSFNTLLISNGGTVANSYGFIGYNSGASNNQVTVTGTNSRWTNNGDLRVGNSGSFNSLLISNGGTVANGDGLIGFFPGANSNQVTVTGPNSRWSNSGELRVGDDNNTNNQLTVRAGGVVVSSGGRIGSTSTNANAHWVLVADPGSAWSNSADLYVGDTGSGNQLVVSNGGTVTAANGYVGFNASSTNNLLRLDNGTLTVTNVGGTAVLDVRRGSLLFNGGSITADRLLLTNGTSSVFTFNAGTLITRSATINNGQDFVVGANAGFGPATWDARSNATPTTIARNLIIGSTAANAALLITNGGTVANSIGYIGYNSGANSNQVTVTGPNSRWTNSVSLFVGNDGSFNSLLISNGGTAANDSGYLGYNSLANNNQVTVTGTNSMWANSAALYVGRAGSFNTLLISNGATVANSSGYLGFFSDASSNQVTVTGTNSLWDNFSDLNVGVSGSFNSLLISNGGQVVNTAGYIGLLPGANNNQVTVTGTNTRWSNSGELRVGYANNTNNQLTVRAGGMVVSSGGRIGSTSSSANAHRVLVADPGSAWSNSADLYVGDTGSGNQLVVSNGGTVANTLGFIGYNSGANNNQVTVTGPNSIWNNSSALYVGNSGSFNTLLITNGGTVANGGGLIGKNSSANNNQVTVTGTNSLWTNSGLLSVGNDGSFNSLLITNGGTVASLGGYIGYTAGANNNQVTVTGTNSRWSSSGALGVGDDFNTNNQLTVRAGGVVVSGDGYIGFYSAGANAHRVLVADPGSAWSNSGSLYVGETGSGNQLLVSNSAVVTATSAYVGFNSSSTNNLLRLDNGTLTVTNAGGTAVLDVRRGSLLFNGGTVTADRLLLTNGASSVFTFNAGTLITRSATISNGQGFVVGANAGFAPATWDVRSNATPTIIAGDLSIGSDARNATLLITNGATLSVGPGSFGSSRLGWDPLESTCRHASLSIL